VIRRARKVNCGGRQRTAEALNQLIYDDCG
jgi:hypothetical protein